MRNYRSIVVVLFLLLGLAQPALAGEAPASPPPPQSFVAWVVDVLASLLGNGENAATLSGSEEAPTDDESGPFPLPSG